MGYHNELSMEDPNAEIFSDEGWSIGDRCPVLTPTAAPAIVKRIGEYDPETKQYPAYVSIDGESEQLVGIRWTASDADRACDEFIFNYYVDHHTPEAAAALAVQLFDPAPSELARRYVNVGWDRKYHESDFSAVAAQVLLPLAHLTPVLNARGDYLVVTAREEIAAPPNDHAIVCDLIDALNAVAAQMPVRPDSISAALHVGGDLYQVGHNGPPRRAMHCPACGDALYFDSTAPRCSCGTSGMWCVV